MSPCVASLGVTVHARKDMQGFLTHRYIECKQRILAGEGFQRETGRAEKQTPLTSSTKDSPP